MLTVHTSPVATLGSRDAGGLNVHVRELARQFDAIGVDVDIFTRRSDPVTPEIQHISPRARVVTIDAGPPAEVFKDDIFCYLPEFSSEVALFSLRDGVRYDIIHSHYWLSGWAAHLLRRYWNVPVVHTFHTLAHLKNAVAGSSRPESVMRLQVERRLVDIVDTVIAPNPDERAELVWRLGGNNANICTIPPGIDLDLFTPRDAHVARRKLGLPERPLVLFVGRIDAVKGIDTLLDAFAALVRTYAPEESPLLVFVGGSLADNGNGFGDDLQPVVTRAEELGIRDNVLFRGSAPQELLPDYYAAATVGAVPSRYESFGLVAVEAMACGLPVVASRAGGLKFTVDDEVSGLLVHPSDPKALADGLRRIIDNPGLRASMQVGARQTAIRFSWQAIAPAMLNLYERLVEGERGDLCCLGEIYAS
ncbi:MAG: glycosyltransferase family 1 protein [Chloroflexi bacterium]|nr:MAG: glycosyltransferase family 1 protein [Chloroflexota bacterium]